MEVILVTGGTGLVGKGIEIALNDPKFGLKRENEKWVFCGSKEGNLLNYEDCEKLFEKYKPTMVIHLAAKVGGLFSNMRNNLEYFRSNMKINDNVLWCAHNFKVKKVLSCLSTCIFPDKVTYPIDETMLHNGPPHDSNFGYSYAKRMITVLNKSYNLQFGHNYISVIPTNIYGPHDNFNLEECHVLPALLHKGCLAKKNNGNLVVLGTGKSLRQFIYSVDLGRLMIWALRNYNETEPIILTVDEDKEVSIAELANIISDVIGVKLSEEFDSSQSDGQHKKTASNAKLRKYLKDFNFTTLEDGIKETYQWLCENYDIARK